MTVSGPPVLPLFGTTTSRWAAAEGRKDTLEPLDIESIGRPRNPGGHDDDQDSIDEEEYGGCQENCFRHRTLQSLSGRPDVLINKSVAYTDELHDGTG